MYFIKAGDGTIINATANLTPVFKRAAVGTLCPLGFQASDTNCGKLLFVSGAIKTDAAGNVLFRRLAEHPAIRLEKRQFPKPR